MPLSSHQAIVVPTAIFAILGVASMGCEKDLAEAVPDAGLPDAAGPPGCYPLTPSQTVFVNRNGGEYTGGMNNPGQNRTSILTGTHTVTAPSIGDDDWSEVMGCVREILSPYNIAVVDEDPMPAVHQEIVLTSLASDIGLPDQDGVAAFSCGVLQGIGWVFVDNRGSRASNRTICELVVWDVAKMTGIDTTPDCTDVNSWVDQACGDKTFIDDDLPCGEMDPRACQCGGNTQNSHAKMLEAYGACDN